MLKNFIENFSLVFAQLHYQDLIDFALVWLVVYRILLLTKSTGAVQILSGLGIVAIAYLTSIYMDFITFNWLLEKFFAHLFLIIVILFQAEIRRALAQIGSNPFLTVSSRVAETHIIEEIAKGALTISQRGYGALIVIEREIALDYFIELGIILHSDIHAELMTAIFHPQSPIHDGAIVIRNGRIFAAGCFLPLSKNPILDKNLGTRHRAAIGLTEETDALVLVVSEEHKSVGLVHGGVFIPDVDHPTIRKHLYEVFGLAFRNERAVTP